MAYQVSDSIHGNRAIDGCLFSSEGNSGFGGLVRNSDGKFLNGFYGHCEDGDIINAEIQGLLNGIRLCWHWGATELFIVCRTLP